MNKTFDAWRWSLAILARNSVALLGLAVLSALWVLAAYQWLSLPESSVWMLLLGMLWALAQALIATSVLAGTAASAAEAAAFGSAPSIGLTFITFNRKLLARTVFLVLPAALLACIITRIFGWINSHSVEVASFLTFHSEKPASHILIEQIFWWIEAVLWIAVCGFLLTLLVILLRSGWQEILRPGGRTFVKCFWRASLFTSLAGVAVFGGLSYLLINWHPTVQPGFSDYTQAALRMGTALLLLAAGWFFTLLSLARLNPRQDSSTGS